MMQYIVEFPATLHSLCALNSKQSDYITLKTLHLPKYKMTSHIRIFIKLHTKNTAELT
jgi:hypothetical protein